MEIPCVGMLTSSGSGGSAREVGQAGGDGVAEARSSGQSAGGLGEMIRRCLVAQAKSGAQGPGDTAAGGSEEGM